MKKKHVFIFIILLIIIAIIGGLIVKMNNDKKIEEQRKLELERNYTLQNAAFHTGAAGRYSALPEYEDLEDGIYHGLYFDLAYYQKTTGKTLTYDEVKKYLSQEFEDDDEIRIYTNGRHSEIADYIEWYHENKDGCTLYGENLMNIIYEYRIQCGEEAYGYVSIMFPNRAVMDEVIKKEADPAYVMDDEIMRACLPSTYSDEKS